MKHIMKRARTAIVGLAVVAASLGTVTVAEASPEPTGGAVSVAGVANAAAGEPTVPVADDAGRAVADLGTVDVELPLDPDGGWMIDAKTGPPVTLGVPGSGSEGELVGGNVVYGDVAEDASVVARPTTDGVQALIVIDGPEAPTEYRFPVDVGGEGAELLLVEGGLIEVHLPGSAEAAATVMPAWAFDADGTPVPTWFTLEGSTLVQTVDHQGAPYPVVADPNTCGTISCTYYFGRRATKDIAGGGSVGLTMACGTLAIVNRAAGAACALQFGALVLQAIRARDRAGHCLKVKYPKYGQPRVLVPQIYTGKYCK
ncbi:MAG: hypothetical protein JWO77_3470 [Ilumatobacteraceae bacterium]|nr:hypothetical protein [Ilumatobacteraceae bacterium]